MPRHSRTERVGVNAIESIFLDMDWIPRIQFQTDVGIDMIVEVSLDGDPLGKFIGVQIKSGSSYFKEESNTDIIFRTDETHIDYWLKNYLPIIIVLHDPDRARTYWEVVNKTTVQNTGKGFRINVPKSNLLTKSSNSSIEDALDFDKAPPIVRKFQKLILDKPILDLLDNGEKVVIELRRWINKTIGRADIKIMHVKNEENEGYEDGKEALINEEILLSEFSAVGIYSYQALHYFYPWADFKTDEEFYEEFSNYDDDYEPGYKIYFVEDMLRNDALPIVPYYGNDETVSYRLQLRLNDYGRTFLDFYGYLNGGKQLSLFFTKIPKY